MEINESRCEELLDKNEILSAHLVMKIMRGDFIVGVDGIDHWISLLKNDDIYLLYRFFIDDDIEAVKVPNKQDVKDVCSTLFYIQNYKDGDEKEIDVMFKELETKTKEEIIKRGL